MKDMYSKQELVEKAVDHCKLNINMHFESEGCCFPVTSPLS